MRVNNLLQGLRRALGRIFMSKRRYKLLVAVIIITISALLTGAVLHFMNNRKVDVPNTEIVQQYRDQLPELSENVKQNPDDANARRNYAVALYVTGDLGEARKQYEAAVKINGKDATSYNNLGNVYRDLNQTNKAVDAYRKAIEINPKSINSYVNLANIQLYTQGKPNDAIDTYQKALDEMPNNNQIRLLLGIAHEQKGDTANAKKVYKDILSRDKDNAAAKASLERLGE